VKAARLRIIALVAWFGAACAPGFACINTFETDIQGYLAHGERASAEAVVARLEATYKNAPTLENSNDLAVGWLLLGKKSEAIALLRDVELKYPGKAIVAANLGTALELSGKDAEALRWIREGVRRDPNEHSGSEWLHARILEVKTAAASDPAWFETHTVLGVDFGTDPVPQLPPTLPRGPSGKLQTVEQLFRAISYQLYERKKFIEPPDAVVGDLSAAAGNLAWLAGKKERIEEFVGFPDYYYDDAISYGVARQEFVKLRKATFSAKFPEADWYPFSNPHRKPDSSRVFLTLWRWPMIVVGLLAVFGGLFYFARFRKP
jgi:tetratricopeptide (TPR) repeat protein